MQSRSRSLRHSAAENQGRAGEGWVTAEGSTEVGRMKEKKASRDSVSGTFQEARGRACAGRSGNG